MIGLRTLVEPINIWSLCTTLRIGHAAQAHEMLVISPSLGLEHVARVHRVLGTQYEPSY